MKPTAVQNLRTDGSYAGGWIGAQFSGKKDFSPLGLKISSKPADDKTDYDENFVPIDSKHILNIHVRHSTEGVHAIKLDYTNGRSTGWRGGAGGKENAFALQDGDDIVLVHCNASSNRILGLSFHTAKSQ